MVTAPSAIAPATAPATSRVMPPGPSGSKLDKMPKFSTDWRDWVTSDEGSDGEIPLSSVVHVPNPTVFNPVPRGRARGSQPTAKAGPVSPKPPKMNPTVFKNVIRGRRKGSHSIEAATSGVSSRAEPEEGTSVSSSYELRDKWWAPLFTGYHEGMDRTSFVLVKKDTVDHWWDIGTYSPQEVADELDNRWRVIMQKVITPKGSSILYDDVAPEEPKFWVLPGKAGNRNLIKLSRADRAVAVRYRQSNGYEFPYVSEPIMQEIEDQRDTWLRDAVIEHLRIKFGSTTYIREDKICSIMKAWSTGRNTFMHNILYRPENGPVQHFFVKIVDPNGREVKKPDPRHYN
ncbi:hypothetical protein FKM82_026662 [Ascaphus truei]